MVAVDWSQYDENVTEINLLDNELTEFSWEGCPPGLQVIDLWGNQITEFNWEGCPPGLQAISLGNNQITEFSWDGCSSELLVIYLDNNKLTEFNWNGCPSGLQHISLWANLITEFNLEGCPENIQISPGKYHKEFQEYKKSYEYIKNYSKKFRPITDQINHLSLVNPEDSKFPVVQKYCGAQFKEFVKQAQEFDLIN